MLFCWSFRQDACVWFVWQWCSRPRYSLLLWPDFHRVHHMCAPSCSSVGYLFGHIMGSGAWKTIQSSTAAERTQRIPCSHGPAKRVGKRHLTDKFVLLCESPIPSFIDTLNWTYLFCYKLKNLYHILFTLTLFLLRNTDHFKRRSQRMWLSHETWTWLYKMS